MEIVFSLFSFLFSSPFCFSRRLFLAALGEEWKQWLPFFQSQVNGFTWRCIWPSILTQSHLLHLPIFSFFRSLIVFCPQGESEGPQVEGWHHNSTSTTTNRINGLTAREKFVVPVLLSWYRNRTNSRHMTDHQTAWFCQYYDNHFCHSKHLYNGCRYNERLNAKTEESNRLGYTGFHG